MFEIVNYYFMSTLGIVITKTACKLQLDRATRWVAIEFKLHCDQCSH
jgi:hypothetical protein